VSAAPRSVSGLNRLPPQERERYLAPAIPASLLDRFQIDPQTFTNLGGHRLLTVTGSEGSASLEVDLRHAPDAADPVFYAHFADTLTGQIIVLLVVINDPESPRFEVDRLPDGTRTQFGTLHRNQAAEVAALQAGLAPGQVRRGLRVFREALAAFESFATQLGHSLFFIEPLAYHNAVIFERHGFAYQQGRRFMESIHYRFSPEGDLLARLDGSTPFRQPGFANRIRGRSWAIHDGIMGEFYTGVTMYKHVGKHAGVVTYPGGEW
jgi:hypothetical protein